MAIIQLIKKSKSEGLSNLLFLIFSQLFLYFSSLIIAFFIPTSLNLLDYSYWQIYLFYTGFVGFFQIGLNDGIYLRYGGEHYSSLNKPLMRSQFVLLAASQFIVSAILSIIIFAVLGYESRSFSLLFAAWGIFISGSAAFFWFINQATNRIKIFSISQIIDKGFFIIAVILLLHNNVKDFEWYVLSNVLSRTLGLIFCVVTNRDIVFGVKASYKNTIEEAKLNIEVGIKLMLANISGILILGIGRLVVDWFGNIKDFGIFSFTITITNFVLLFISSISIILYPFLRRLPSEKVPRLFDLINSLLILFMGISLLLYLPLYIIIDSYLIEYRESLKYLFLMMPLCVYQGKMQLVINTYYKTLREESKMLNANFSAVLISLTLSFISMYFFESIYLVILSMVIATAWRCYSSEVFLKRKMGLKSFKNIFLETGLILSFIAGFGFFEEVVAFYFYICVIIIYIFLNYKQLRNDFKLTLNLLRGKNLEV